MPRAKKTMSGTPGQGVQAIKGQTYGQGVAQEALQRAMPTPNVASQTEIPRGNIVENPNNTPVQQTPTSQISIEDAQKMVSGLGGVLNAPDDQPNKPFTTGLNAPYRLGASAPGFVRRNKIREQMMRLSEITGDPIFMDLADKSGY